MDNHSTEQTKTYVNIPSAQQLVPAKGLVIMYPGLDLGLTRVNDESALFVPKSREHLEREHGEMRQKRITSYTQNLPTWGDERSCAPCLHTSRSRRV